MVRLGVHTAFFFICFLSTAISYSVSFIHGAHLLPGLASGGGGANWASALLVEMPAIELWTFVPRTPGGRDRPGLECLSLCRFLGDTTTSIPDLISDSAPDESDDALCARERPRGPVLFLWRSRGREVFALCRPASKVRRKCGALM